MLRVRDLALLLSLLAPSAGAVERVCVAGGTPEAPLDFTSPSTWAPPGVPDAETDLQLAAACHVRCAAPSCTARGVLGLSAEASLTVGPGATLTLHGCDDVAADDVANLQCGGKNGFRFAAQGMLVGSSAEETGLLFVRGAALPGSPDVLRLVLSSSRPFAVGDFLQVRGGPSRGHVYRLVGVDFSGCPDPAHCTVDARLHDPDMEFGRNAQSAGYPVDVGYATGGLASVRVAGADEPDRSARRLDRCVEICRMRNGDECVDSGFLTRDHAYVGFMLGFTRPDRGHPADPLEMLKRHLVVSSLDDVPAEIDGFGLVDRVCFADPVHPGFVPASGSADRDAVLWPGFWGLDAWAVFRPAVVRYAGLEGDGGLGFHASCLDADFAFFDNWARLATHEGTAACQRPFQDTVITSWQEGRPPDVVQQSNSCNAHSVQIREYDALSGDRVAVVDTRTPVDTSATCDTGEGPSDPAPDSGHHGMSISDTRFDPNDPPTGWLVRHAGDDGAILRTESLGPATWEFRDWTWWYMTHGQSGEAIEFASSAPGQEVRVRNAKVVMWTGGYPCDGAFQDSNGSGHNVSFAIDGLLYLDPQHEGSIIGRAVEGHEIAGALAFGDPDGVCPVLQLSGSLRNSWFEGWNRLVGNRVYGIRGVRFDSRDSVVTGSVLGRVGPGEPVTIEDFVFTGIPGVGLVEAFCGVGCQMLLRNGYAEWRTPVYGNGIGNFSTDAAPDLSGSLEGLIVRHRSLVRCSAGWGESGENIGVNRVVGAIGAAINQPQECPLAATQVTDPGYPPDQPHPFVVHDGSGDFGPVGRVGLPSGSPLLAEMEIATRFAVNVACDNGLDDDADGLVDFPADPGCVSADSDREQASCGLLGVEAVLLLASFRLGRGRARKAHPRSRPSKSN